MYLSMWIFAEWLKDFQPTIQIKENTMTIDTIRLFSSSTPMNDHTLYIGRMKDFSEISEDFVLCSHRNDQILLPCCDVEEVLNRVLEAMEF